MYSNCISQMNGLSQMKPILIVFFLLCAMGQVFSQTLKARVTDAQSGEALPMATFQVNGLGKGAVSAVDGSFSYRFPRSGTYTVSLRYTGYETLEMSLSVQRDTGVEFRLQPEASLLNAVVVTGTRTPKLLKDIPVVTTVIAAEEIQKTGALTIADVLQTELPGVEFDRQMDGQVVMNMQGMGGTDILFLVDGERMAGESLNNIDYERLNMDNVERVEIVRGAGSALYGSNAIGGVVNIITKQAERPWSLNLNTRYGSNNEQKYAANLGFDKGKVNSITNFSYRSSDTYTLKGTDSAATESIIYGGRTFNANQNLRYDLNSRMYLRARGGFYYRERDYSQTRQNRYRDGSAGLVYDFNINEKAHFRADYAFDMYDKFNFYPRASTLSHEYRNMHNTIDAQFDYSFSKDNVLTTGLEYFNETLLSNQFDTTATGEWMNYMSHTAVLFAQHDISFKERYYLVYGARMDYNTRFQLPHVSPKVSFMYKYSPFSLRFSYAGGFRAPSLKEMFSNYDMGGQGWFIIYGDPHLRPEKSHNTMLSLEYARKTVSLTANGYYCYTRDKITTVYNEAQDTAFYRNVNRSHTAGFDANFMLRLPYGFGLKLCYAYVYDLQKEGGVNVSYARPHTGIARFDYRLEKKWYELAVSLSGRVLSALNTSVIDGYGEGGEPEMKQVHYPAYTLWKLNVSQKFMKSITLNLGIDNLFNYRPSNYDLVSSVSPGTTFFVALSLDIDDMVDAVKRRR